MFISFSVTPANFFFSYLQQLILDILHSVQGYREPILITAFFGHSFMVVVIEESHVRTERGDA